MLQLRTIVVAAFALLFLPLTVPLMTWRVFPFGDLSAFHVPMRFIYREALRAGDSFLWTPWLGSGLYVHAEGQTGMAHPLHLLAYGLLPLTIAINVEMLAAYALAFSGMGVLLRRLGIRTEAAFAGALTFAFGGFMLPHLNHLNAIAVAAHIPWILLAADLLVAGSALGFAAVAVLLGSQVLLGFPQVVWMTGVIVGWFAMFRLATGTPLRRILLLACALAFGLLIGAVQVLPTLDAARDSFRSLTTLDFRLAISLHPWNLVQLFSPYALKHGTFSPSSDFAFPHELGLYAGALATISVAWILVRLRTLPHRSVAMAFLILAVLGLVLALGRHGYVYQLLAQLPILSSFRGAARHVLIVHFALAGLVALALDDLLRGHADATRARIWPVLIPAAISIAATAVALAGPTWPVAEPVVWGPASRAIGGLAFALLVAWLFVRGVRGARHAVPLLVLVSAVDLACWGLPYAYAYRPAPIGRLVPNAGLPPRTRPGDLVYPQIVLDDMNKYPLWRLRTQQTYLGIARGSVLDPETPEVLRLAGVKWRWTNTGWAMVEDPMPRVRLVSEWRVSADVPRDLAGLDIARVALVDASPGSTSAAGGRARLTVDRPGRLTIHTRAPAGQLLVVAERYHAGWTARIDRVEAPVRRVYGEYFGCVVPAGSHEVKFVFAPASARHGLWLTLGGLALTIVVAASMHRVQRSAKAARTLRTSTS